MLATLGSAVLSKIAFLFFLDSCCSPGATVFNCSQLVKGMWNASCKKTVTLGGNYEAPYEADLHYFGKHDYDEDLPMSVVSWNWLEKSMKATVSEPDSEGVRIICFQDIPIQLSVSWVDGVLAGSLEPLIEYHKRCCVSFSSWTGRRTDDPSELLSRYKIVREMSPSQIRRLDSVHRALQTTWASSEQDLRRRLTSGELVGTNFNEHDLKLYFEVFEKDLEALKGKEKDKSHYIIRAEDMLKENESAMYCDVFEVSSCKFLIACEMKSGFVLVTSLTGQKSDELTTALGECRDYFISHGCNVVAVEFDRGGPDETLLMTRENLRTIPRSTHVSIAELNIKLIKERMRGVVTLLPYDISKKLVLHLVIGATMILNTITRSEGTSSQLKLLGFFQDYLSQFALAPGEYCEVHTISNNLVTQPRTVSALALHPDPKNLAEWCFISLETGELFTRHYAEAYPMPFSSQIIDRVNVLASMDPTRADEEVAIDEPRQYTPIYPQPPVRRRGRPRRNLRAEANVIQGAVQGAQGAEANAIQGAHDADAIQGAPAEEAPEHAVDNVNFAMCISSYRVSPDFMNFENEPTETWKDTEEDRYMEIEVIDDGELVAVTENGCSVYCSAEKSIRYCAVAQMSIRDSIDQYGEEKTSASVGKELLGLLDKNAFTVMDKNFVRNAKRVIPMSLFLVMKRSGVLKARMVAGGHRQERRFYDVGRTASPTVSTQSLMSVLNIAACEGRKMMTLDIKQAFLEADIDEEIYMIVNKDTAKEMVKINPSYKDNVMSDGKILVKLNKALYGCVQSSKLWYDRISKWLLSKGFISNPADKCIFNRVERNGYDQLTVALYVDDLLITCESQNLIDIFLNEVENEFDISSMSKGDQLEYLGMTIDKSSGEYIEIGMCKYIEDIIISNNVRGISRVPASPNLFDISENARRLSDDEADNFHSVVASLLYLALRVRPDIMVAVTFLCSRVAFSTEEDLIKLKKLLQYLNLTKDLTMRVGSFGDSIGINVFCDASFAVYQDAKSVGGLFATGGRGCIYSKCGKLRLVAKSSTEAELITLSDGASIAIWAQMFLKYQGYSVIPNLYEDNKSTITMMKSGKGSERTRHVNIKFYFVKQYIDNGSVKLEYCPTLSMIADALTKPLQGKQFEFLRSFLLGHKHIRDVVI